jgi:hypothetical protein
MAGTAVSDLLEMDGLHVRTEMRAGRVWTNVCRDIRSGQEWVALMRAQLGVEDGRDVVSVPYAMPVEPLCVGAFIGHGSLGTTAIGCVTRVHDGEIWVVPGSTAPKDSGVQRLRRRSHYDEW